MTLLNQPLIPDKIKKGQTTLDEAAMKMTLNISPQEQAAYAAEAAAEGLSVEEWLKKLANQRISPNALPGIEGKALLNVCAKVRGLLTDQEVGTLFTRNPSTARPLDLLIDTNVPSEATS